MSRPFALICLLLLCLIIGCGGGGGTGTLTSSGGTTGVSITLMSDDARDAVIQQSVTALKAVPETNAIADPNALLNAAQKVSGLNNLVVTPDGNVTGNFSDGVPFVFFNNKGLGTSSTFPVSRSKIKPLTSVRASTGSVQIMDSLDPVFSKDRTNDDPGMFNRHGYPGTVITQATIEAYRALGTLAKPMAVLEMAGHGGICQTKPKGGLDLGYGIWTATMADFNKKSPTYNANLYANDLKDASIGVATAYSGYDSVGYKTLATHYIILPQFIQKYNWRFTARSYVALSVCSGMSSQAGTFRQVLFNQGASAIAGWTDSVNSDSCAGYISFNYDRMLGANEYKVTTPGHRPFGLASILGDLYRRNLATIPGPYDTTTTWDVKWNPVGDQFSILNPEITQVQVNQAAGGQSANISFSGDFAIPGTGTPQFKYTGSGGAITSLSSGLYGATIPSTSSGTISVTETSIDGLTLTSNSRTITLFSGSVSADNKQVGTGTAAGTITISVTEPVHIQADVESSFQYPSDVLPTQPAPGTGLNGEKIYNYPQSLADSATISASGTIVTQYFANGMLQSTDQRSTSGGGTVMNTGPGGMVHSWLSIPLDPTQPAYLDVQISSPLFITQKDTITASDGTTGPPQTTMLGGGIDTGLFAKDEYLPIQMDSSYNISAGSLDTGLLPLGVGPIMGEHTLNYNFSTTNPPPLGTAR